MTTSEGYWVHDLDPMAISFGDDFGIRWYGLAYVASFLLGWWFLREAWKRKRSPLDPDQQSNLIFFVVLGVVIGGRVGYMLLYDLPYFLQAPWSVVAVWEGGMASHGGFVGVILAAWLFSRREKITLLRLGDLLTPIVPAGLMLGRAANFINGELWGKVASVPWAVVFPQSAPPGTPIEEIPPRHPSQLYEGALEGALLLGWMQWRFWKSNVAEKYPGQLGGEFLLLYAAGRIIAEQFREPDASLIFGMSRGIFYSIFVLIGGLGLIIYARKYRPRESEKPPKKYEKTGKTKKAGNRR